MPVRATDGLPAPRPQPRRRTVALAFAAAALAVAIAVATPGGSDGDRVVTRPDPRPLDVDGRAGRDHATSEAASATRRPADPTDDATPSPPSPTVTRPPSSPRSTASGEGSTAPSELGPGRAAAVAATTGSTVPPGADGGPPPAVAPLPSSTTSTTVPPPPLAPDQQNCPNLGLVAIGDATDAPPAVAALAPAFRAQAPSITRADALVCALPLARWRDDLAIQPLLAAGSPVGVLVAGLDGRHPVIRFSEVEWTSFQFRDGGTAGHNFAGVPTGRERIGDVEIIRTTRGGLVMERPDTWGNAVVGGAWETWMRRGGPAGEMGLPRSKPTGRYGLGAFQDFDHGHLLLPGVTTDLEAEAQPASRYEWHPLDADDAALATPGPNSIVTVTGTSYYVDGAGIRHWLRTGGDWSCAYWNLGAREQPVRGWVLARFPVGPAFVCPG